MNYSMRTILRDIESGRECGLFDSLCRDSSVYSTTEAANNARVSPSQFRYYAAKHGIPPFHTGAWKVRHAPGGDKNIKRHLWTSDAVRLVYQLVQLSRRKPHQ